MSKSSNILKSRPTKLVDDCAEHHVQVLRDLAGDPTFAVVPWADFQRLVSAQDEDTALIAAAEAARGDDVFPEDVARRLIAGEPALKVLREWRGLTQAKLADRSGVATQYISQIERGARNLGHAVAKRLAPVLGVTVDSLIDL